MRKLLAFAALAAVVCIVATEANAGPIWKVALASSDAGSSQTVAVNAKTSYCVQAKYSQTCMKLGNTDGGGLLAGLYGADCTKEFIIPQDQAHTTTSMWPFFCFDTAGRNALVVANIDGGPANTNLYQLEKNVTNAYGPTTFP